MPKSTKHLALARQWQMLNLIPTRAPGITARALTERLAEEGFAVSKRTVERDLNELSRQFGLATHSADGLPPFGWYFVSGKRSDLGSVELTDAVSLSLAGDILEQMLPAGMLQAISGKIDRAREKLQSLKGHPMARWSEKVRFVPPTLVLRPPHIRPNVVDVVQEALTAGRQIEVRYAPFNEKPRELTLNPLSLVLRGPVSYLVATAFAYTDVRLFALHRMESARMGGQACAVPEGYNIDAHIDAGALNFGSCEPLLLKAALSDELATYLSETALGEDQKISHRNGRWELTVTVRDTWQLQFWILSQGSAITVLSPKAYRERIHAALRNALQNYQ